MGSILSITIPDIPSVSFPILSITEPVFDYTKPVNWSFNIDSIVITNDPMIQAILTRLSNNISKGGTGLTEAVETAIFNRDLEREEQQLSDSIDKTMSTWAKKGFSLPDGMIAHSVAELQNEYMNRLLSRSREISIKQAELEQANLFKSMELGVQLTRELITMLIQYEELVLRAQEDTAKFANEYIDMQIKIYTSKVEAFKAIAATNELIIRGEIAKVELYKAELEGQKIIGDINQQTVTIYKTQIEATSSLVDRYKADIQAMVVELEAEKTKVEANKIQFDIWAKKIDAVISQYNAETDMFKASSGVNISTAEFRSKQAALQAQLSIDTAQLSIKSFETAERSMNLKSSMVLEAQKSVATATASMAAGAMAALSVHSGLSYGESRSLEAGE